MRGSVKVSWSTRSLTDECTDIDVIVTVLAEDVNLTVVYAVLKVTSSLVI
jgi:hypothetical protein